MNSFNNYNYEHSIRESDSDSSPLNWSKHDTLTTVWDHSYGINSHKSNTKAIAINKGMDEFSELMKNFGMDNMATLSDFNLDDDLDLNLVDNIVDNLDANYEIINAPTPYNGYVDDAGMSGFVDNARDINDISSDINVCTNNGDNTVITDNTVIVDNNYSTVGQIAYTDNNYANNYVESTAKNSKRKRKVSFNYEDSDSEDDDDDESVCDDTNKAKGKKNGGNKKSKCMSRNAIAARENREKKKQYLKDTEKRRDELLRENAALKSALKAKSDENEKLKKDNNYLSAIVHNIPAINSIIEHNASNPDLKVMGTSFSIKEEDKKSNSNCYEVDKSNASKAHKSCSVDGNTRKSHRIASKMENPGICFHIKNNNSFTLELCSNCSDASNKLLKMKKK